MVSFSGMFITGLVYCCVFELRKNFTKSNLNKYIELNWKQEILYFWTISVQARIDLEKQIKYKILFDKLSFFIEAQIKPPTFTLTTDKD